MQPTQKFEEDVAFVREAVEKRDQRQYNSIAIVVLWAIILVAGYIVNDFRPQVSHLYWPIATSVGFLISIWIGVRAKREEGVAKRSEGAKHTLHWSSLFFTIAAIVFIALRHGLDGWVMGQFITLISGVTWYLGGLHLDRRFLLPGVVCIVSAPAVDYLAPYPWTMAGLAIAASLIISALWMKPHEKSTV